MKMISSDDQNIRKKTITTKDVEEGEGWNNTTLEDEEEN